MNAKLLVLSVLCLSVVVQGAKLTTEFAEWMTKFGKEYDLEELPRRLNNFEVSVIFF